MPVRSGCGRKKYTVEYAGYDIRTAQGKQFTCADKKKPPSSRRPVQNSADNRRIVKFYGCQVNLQPEVRRLNHKKNSANQQRPTEFFMKQGVKRATTNLSFVLFQTASRPAVFYHLTGHDGICTMLQHLLFDLLPGGPPPKLNLAT